MRKEVTVCDKCHRQINENEKYITRPKNTTSAGYCGTEDICGYCVFDSTDNYTLKGYVLTEGIQGNINE